MTPATRTTAADSSAERALVAALLASVMTALVQPRWMPALMALTALVFVVVARSDLAQDTVREPSDGSPLQRLWRAQPATLAFAALAVYSAVTASWAPVPAASIGKVAGFLLLILTTALGVALWPRLRLLTLDRLVVWIVAAALAGGLLIAHEVLRDQALTRALYNTLPGLIPTSRKHISVQGGLVTQIGSYVLNRNIGALNLLLWPLLLCIVGLGRRHGDAGKWGEIGGWGLWLALALAALALVATLRSHHESSQIAIVVSVLVFALARWSLPAARRLVLAGWLTACLGMLPLVVLAHTAGLQTSALIPETGQARIILWNFTAHKYLERPLLGVGAHATRTIDDELKPTARREPGQIYAERTGQHSHNFFVQTWFELGLVGALLFLACGVLLWRAIATLANESQPYALAGATSAMCLAALTWGLWQEWYLSLFGLAVLLTALGNQIVARLAEFLPDGPANRLG